MTRHRKGNSIALSEADREHCVTLWSPLSDRECNLCLSCGRLLAQSFAGDADLRISNVHFCSELCQQTSFQLSYAWFFARDINSKARNNLFKLLNSLPAADKDMFLLAIRLVCQLLSTAAAQEASPMHKSLSQQWNGLLDGFPLSSFEGLRLDCELSDLAQEIFSMFLALLVHELRPLQAKTWTDEQMLVYQQALHEVFTTENWKSLLVVCDVFAVQCAFVHVDKAPGASSRLSRAQAIVSISTHEERMRALEEFSDDEIEQSVLFLEGEPWPAGAWDRCATSAEAVVWQERAMARISQCASLVTANTISVHHSQYSNPFAETQSAVLMLSLLLVPTELARDSSQRQTKQRISFSQSCVPNVHVDAFFDSARSSMSLLLTANCDIEDDECLTYSWGTTSDNGTVDMSKRLGLILETPMVNLTMPCRCIHCKFALYRDARGRSKAEHLSFTQSVCDFISAHAADQMIADGPAKKVQRTSECCESKPTLSSVLLSSSLQPCSWRHFCNELESFLDSRLSNSPTLQKHESCSRLELKVFRELRNLGNYYFIRQQTVCGVVIYSQLLRYALVKESEDVSCRSVLTIFAEMAHSLSIVGLDWLSQSFSDVRRSRHRMNGKGLDSVEWTVPAVLLLYRFAAWLDPSNSDFQYDQKKFNAYRPLAEVYPMVLADKAIVKSTQYATLIDKTEEGTVLRAYATTEPLLSTAECHRIVACAESTAGDDGSGWSTSRHYTVPTTDLPLHTLDSSLVDWFVSDVLCRRVQPLLFEQFIKTSQGNSLSVIGMRMLVNDVFVVKYSRSQRLLPLHSDQSSHSMVIALNDVGEYIGGGTYFVDLQSSLRPSIGSAVSFTGALLHGGDPVVEGTRYIIAAFYVLVPEEREDATIEDSPTKSLEPNPVLSSLFHKNVNNVQKSNADAEPAGHFFSFF